MKNKFSRKSLLLVSMTVVLATVINLFAGVVAFAAEDTTTYTIEAVPFSKGQGTEEDPYLISDPGHLVQIGTSGLDKHYKLTKNIDLSKIENNTIVYAAWTPLPAFSGTFDGNGHTISGLTITNANITAETHIGMFKIVNGTVKNLTLDTVSITASVSKAARFDIGAISAQLGDNASILNCTVNGTIRVTQSATADNVNTRARIGGLIGYAGNATIAYCESNIAITATSNTSTNSNKGYKENSYVGGIVGQSLGTVQYCVNNGDINVTVETDSAYAGGICGTNVTWNGNAVAVQNCVNNGDVSVKFPAENNQNTSEIGAGGILGYISSDKKATLKNNFNFGTIESSKYAGQILGQNNNSSASTYAGNYGLENNGNLGGNVDNAVVGATDTEENMLINQPTLGTQVVGYQTSEAKEGNFNLRLVAVMEGGYANLTNVGFTVSASYGNVTKDEKTFTIKTLYGSISAEANTKAEKEYTAEELGGDYIFVLACKNLPENVGYITFTVTTFYTDANGTHSNMVQTFTVNSDDIPSADMPEAAA